MQQPETSILAEWRVKKHFFSSIPTPIPRACMYSTCVHWTQPSSSIGWICSDCPGRARALQTPNSQSVDWRRESRQSNSKAADAVTEITSRENQQLWLLQGQTYRELFDFTCSYRKRKLRLYYEYELGRKYCTCSNTLTYPQFGTALKRKKNQIESRGNYWQTTAAADICTPPPPLALVSTLWAYRNDSCIKQLFAALVNGTKSLLFRGIDLSVIIINFNRLL